MLFNSYIFLLGFLPICLIGYFTLIHYKKHTLALFFLFGMSLWFYGYFNPSYLLIILFSILFNYILSRLILNESRYLQKKAMLLTAIGGNLGILFYYKYFNFFIENLNYLLKDDFVISNIVLPLGISFFTFQQISYIVDTYRGDVKRYSFIEYATFVAYFPQLIAGPIVSHDELIPQFRDEGKRSFSWDNCSKGIYIFSMGLAKKVLIADTFGNAVNWGFENIPELDSTNAIVVMLAYTLQIYFDFSGYCDMEIGLAKMMNIDLPLNFNSPYKAYSIEEFWDRWHMTLTRFFTKYVYIPLGGNRKGKCRTYLNVMIVYLISGIWHGANWSFILWGILHGIATVVNKVTKRWTSKLPNVINAVFTFTFINLAWVLFRSESIGQAFSMYERIFACDFGMIHEDITECFMLPEFAFLFKRVLSIEMLIANPEILCIFFLVAAMIIVFFVKNAFERMKAFTPNLFTFLSTMILMIWSILSFSGVSTFLYFNF